MAMRPIRDASWRPSTRARRVTPSGAEPAPRAEGLPDALAELKALPSTTSVRLLAKLARLARHDKAPILLEGESGVGKTLLARAAHQLSRRAKEPFVESDLTTTRGDLALSHLFGHVRGAYTGAVGVRAGAFQTAQHGVLFLDELGKTEMPVQAMLLRSVEDGSIKPVGADRPMVVDVRCVFAMNRPLDQCVKDGTLHPDLAARITHFKIRVPPVRERMDDVPLLVKRAITRATRMLALSRSPIVSDELMAILLRYRWPDNVREILGCVERIVAEADGETVLRPGHIPEESSLAKLVSRRGGNRLARGEAAKALKSASGNKSAAARLAQVHRSTIHRRLKRDQT